MRAWTRAGRGSLRSRLLVLVLLPLAAGAVGAQEVLAAHHADLQATTRVERALRTVEQLRAAREALVREVTPSFTSVLLDEPRLSDAVGVAPAARPALALLTKGQVAATRRATDAALAAVTRGTDAGSLAARTAAELAQLRERAAPEALFEAYAGYDRLVHGLIAGERAELTAAITDGLDAGMRRTLNDLQLVSGTVQAASGELPLMLGTRVPLGSGQDDNQRNWLTYWGAYRAARVQLDTLSTPAVRAAWAQATTDYGLVSFERLADTMVGRGVDASSLPVARANRLMGFGARRQQALDRVVQVASDQAVAVAEQRREAAAGDLRRVLALGAAAAALALGLVLLTTRWVTRPLRQLAQDATGISRGRLADVTEAGPREVRVVARALGATVAALRQVEDQARSVARGDLAGAAAAPLSGPLGEAVHASLQGIVTAMRQREELQSSLAHQAAHDALTSLPNRAQAMRLIEGALHRSTRTGAPVGLLFVDLDRFKRVNDDLGHAAGDEVLRVVASRMERLVRAGDVVCRLGGDEFVVVLERVEEDPAALLALAERLVAEVSQGIATQGRTARVGASIGIAVAQGGQVDAGHLLAEADAAAYRAKSAGRGRAELFDEDLRAELAARQEVEAAIHRGLEGDEFLLHYQPVVDAVSGALRGFEALLRWERPGHGLVAPYAFVPLAEKSHLIVDLGRYALRAATAQLVAWTRDLDMVGEGVTVAVNVSGRHLASDEIVTDVREALAASGLAPGRLVLEITETTVVDDPRCVERLVALRELGVSVAIDDFGTGYTSIGQMQRLPVDTLKIDRSFVASDEPSYQELVHLIISAAHVCGLRVIAEGVEETSQLGALRDGGCDEVQGYLISRPMPPEAVPAALPAVAAATGVPVPA